MAIDYSKYRPDLSTFDIGTGRYGARTPQYNRQINRIRRYFRTPRNYQKNAAGLGYVLPKIGGLRLRDIDTAQGRRTAITGGPGNFIYGFTDRNKFQIGRVGEGVGLIARSGGGGGGGGAAAPAVPAPPTDEFTKYEKDHKWIADYLRNLKAQETATTDIYKNQFLPNLTSALNAYSNLGSQTAQRIAESGLSGAAAYGAAANVAPVEAAGATGSFDPISLAANQAAARATGAAAEAQAKFGATQSALAPVDTAAGILANIQRGYSAISAEYGKKRLEDQMKLEQWIEEQKSAALDREVQQQYNLGLLGVRKGTLEADIASDKADREEKGDIRTLERDGWIRLPKGAGTRGLNTTTANDGTVMYKPRDKGKGGGSNGLTANQTQQLGDKLYDKYVGTARDAVGNVTGQGPGFRDLPIEQQVQKIETWVRQEVSRGNIPNNRAAIAAFISSAIPILQIGKGGAYEKSPRGSTATWGQRIAANIVGG